MKVKYNEEEAKHIFFTSDTHFDHKNILRFCNRPWETVEEMNQGLIDNWNSVVGPDDIVFHLGDVSFGGNTNLTKYVLQVITIRNYKKVFVINYLSIVVNSFD